MLPELVARLLASIRRLRPNHATPPQLDARPPDLESLAATGEYRAVPDLLPLLVAGDALSPAVARTISTLVSGVSPSQLNWLDAEARRFYSVEFGVGNWFSLAPGVVPDLCRAIRPHWRAIGILASHPNGFVRQIAVRELGRSTDGTEIPFLTLRANDWVTEVADTAGDLLAARFVPANRAAVVNALPYIVRMLGHRRQDHHRLVDALGAVLISDDGRDAIATIRTSDRAVARAGYALLFDLLPTHAVVEAALAEPDPVARRQAVRRLPAIGDPSTTAERLARLVSGDRAPSVRHEALALLERCDASRARAVRPHALLDRSAAVRGLARFLASRLDPSLDVRGLYLEALEQGAAATLPAAVLGLGECGTKADGDLVRPLLTADLPRLRRAALQTTASLDPDRVLPLATAALEDSSSGMRSTALRILRRQAYRVDFAALARRMPSVVDSRARKGFLMLFAEAPKWDAAVFLLTALGDPDRGVRDHASDLLDTWVARFNRRHTAPTPAHLHEIRESLDRHASALRGETAGFLRSIIS